MHNEDGPLHGRDLPLRTELRHVVILVVVGCIFLLPWIDRSFGTTEENPGKYFGPFVRNFEQFGLFALQGVPLGVTVLSDPAAGYPYLNHPPALSWVMLMFGSAEWQMRLCTVVGLIISSILTYLLLARRCGVPASLLAALLLLVTPVMAFYSQCSYEPVVLPLGLTMCLAIERLASGGLGPRQRRGWMLALAGASLIGPWIDWAFAYYCVALVPLAWQSGALRVTARRLLLPALCSASSLGLHLIWRQAAVQVGRREGIFSLGQLVDASAGQAPSLVDLLQAWSQRIPESFSLPVLVIACFGILALWRADRRLSIALWFTGVIHVLVFRGHSMHGHQMFFAYSAIVVVACVALGLLRGPLARLPLSIRCGLTAVVFLWPAWHSLALIQATTTTFFRDHGTLISAATKPMTRAEGQGEYMVGWGVAGGYGYYIDSPRVRLLPIETAQELARGLPRVRRELGVRYLWLRLEDMRGKPLRDDSDFAELFAPHAMVRHPELEVVLDLTGRGQLVRIREAWLVTLRQPGS